MNKISSEEQLNKCYATICKVKGIKPTSGGLSEYIGAITSLYHAVCIDIDDTLTYKNKEEKNQVVKALARLTKRNVIICFITGRGITSAFEFINGLKIAIADYDESIHERQFCRWYCITNNGCMLFRYDSFSNKGFLGESVSIVEPEIRKEYLAIKPEIQEIVAAFLSEKFHICKDDILKDSKASSGDNSLRFPFLHDFSNLIDSSLMNEIKGIVKKYTPYSFGVNRGVYHKNNKTVIEVSMTTKGGAIGKVEEILGIPKNKMARIGDQGDLAGNDYEMLDCPCGFSVGNYSSSELTCWPVVKSTSIGTSILKGLRGTLELLETLKLFPTICLEKPKESFYLPRLALSEKKSISINRETYQHYQQLVQHTLTEELNHSDNAWDYIDEKTGGFYIHDSEYELLKVTNPDHILFHIFNTRMKTDKPCNEPMLLFSLRTDTGLLLRGPYNYYYGLTFRAKDSINISLKFLRRLNQTRVYFFKTCLKALKKWKSIDANDSITRRTLLGVMDSIRDYLLILINVHLQEYAGSEDKLYTFNQEDKELYELFLVAKQNLINMYNCLFNNIGLSFIHKFYDFLEQRIMVVADQTEKYLEGLAFKPDFDFRRGCRVWREIDSFYENVIAVDTSLNKMISECDSEEKEFLLYGIRYGSLELPIITAMLIDVKYGYHDISYGIGALCLSTKYESNHNGALDTKRSFADINRSDVNSTKYIHVLMDDNLVTGRTLQIAVNMLVNSAIFPEKVFVVRYPAINRIRHMFLPNHGAPDPDLFWEFIYGLTSPTPYSRLNYENSYKKKPGEKYLDELGEFNKTRTYVLNLLFKNGLFIPNGEVAKRGE